MRGYQATREQNYQRIHLESRRVRCLMKILIKMSGVRFPRWQPRLREVDGIEDEVVFVLRIYAA